MPVVQWVAEIWRIARGNRAFRHEPTGDSLFPVIFAAFGLFQTGGPPRRLVRRDRVAVLLVAEVGEHDLGDGPVDPADAAVGKHRTHPSGMWAAEIAAQP